jgi:hypothetical protein
VRSFGVEGEKELANEGIEHSGRDFTAMQQNRTVDGGFCLVFMCR